jgi:transposase
VSARRGQHVAAVAVARKLAVLAWHLLRRGEDYAWVRPALHAKKLRDLELRAGHPPRKGQRGPAYEYNLKGSREREKRRAEQAETAYRRLTEGWNPKGPKRVRTGAAREGRPS